MTLDTFVKIAKSYISTDWRERINANEPSHKDVKFTLLPDCPKGNYHAFGRASESGNMYEIEYFAETEVFKVQKYEASDCNIGRVIDFMNHSISVDGVSVFFVA